MAQLTTDNNYSKTFDLLRQELITTIQDAGLGGLSLDRSRISTHYVPELVATAVRFTTELLADKLADDSYAGSYSYKIPTSWWQMFKRDLLPRWITRKWPVQYKRKYGKVTVRFTRYATYPKCNTVVQQNPTFYVKTLGGLEVVKDVTYQEGGHE